MREHRPVIALDFPSFEAVKEFLSLFPAEEKAKQEAKEAEKKKQEEEKKKQEEQGNQSQTSQQSQSR